jgi:hypothetical protein
MVVGAVLHIYVYEKKTCIVLCVSPYFNFQNFKFKITMSEKKSSSSSFSAVVSEKLQLRSKENNINVYGHVVVVHALELKKNFAHAGC